MNEHEIDALAPDRLVGCIGEQRAAALHGSLQEFAACMRGRRLVNVTGDDQSKGGVFEVLRTTLPYLRGAGVEVVWVDLPTSAHARPALEYFHVLAHGRAPSRAWADTFADRAAQFADFGREAAAALTPRLRASDVVVLHDTQAAPLAAVLGDWRDQLTWHAHIGTPDSNELVDRYWSVLVPLLDNAAACVFYLSDYAPQPLRSRSVVAGPSVDPSTTKNQLWPQSSAREALADPDRCSPLSWVGGPGPAFGPDVVTAAQLSRWDPLKDMSGAVRVFARVAIEVSRFVGMVVGPSAQSSSEQRELQQAVAALDDLPTDVRRRVRVGVIERCGSFEHDQAVRAVQSSADIVLQKSVQEGFGLTVTEAMLRSKPVVAAAVGGIPCQIDNGRNGVLVPAEATDEQWAAAVRSLVDNPQLAACVGHAARASVLDRYAVDRHLLSALAAVRRVLSRA